VLSGTQTITPRHTLRYGQSSCGIAIMSLASTDRRDEK
jgi:hypothetical protein